MLSLQGVPVAMVMAETASLVASPQLNAEHLAELGLQVEQGEDVAGALLSDLLPDSAETTLQAAVPSDVTIVPGVGEVAAGAPAAAPAAPVSATVRGLAGGKSGLLRL